MYVWGFSGIIPKELGALTRLERLSLHQNQLSGELCAILMELTRSCFIEGCFSLFRVTTNHGLRVGTRSKGIPVE